MRKNRILVANLQLGMAYWLHSSFTLGATKVGARSVSSGRPLGGRAIFPHVPGRRHCCDAGLPVQRLSSNRIQRHAQGGNLLTFVPGYIEGSQSQRRRKAVSDVLLPPISPTVLIPHAHLNSP